MGDSGWRCLNWCSHNTASLDSRCAGPRRSSGFALDINIQRSSGHALQVPRLLSRRYIRPKRRESTSIERLLHRKKEQFESIRQVGSTKLIEKYLAPLLMKYLKEMRPAIPFPLRPFLNAGSLTERMGSDKRAETGQLRWFLWQLIAITIQMFSLIVAVVIAAFAA